MTTGCRWVAPISRAIVLTIVLLPLLFACAQNVSVAQWKSPLYQDHPLVGMLWHTETEQFVSEDRLWANLGNSRFLILGEKHDNPDHHALQLDLLSDLIDRNLLSSLTLEMLDSTSDDALQALSNQQLNSSEALKDYLNWDSEGWNWEFYGPLVEEVYDSDIPVYSGNISDETVGAVYGQPTPLEIAEVFGETVMNRLTQDIDESHCGLLPESQFSAMVRVQQTRDFTMAKQMPGAERNKLSLLIAGNYHARQDLGVPNYLLTQNNDLKRHEIVSVSFMEVRAGEDDPVSYLDSFSEQIPYDYIWFTPALTSEDYCDSLRQGSQ